MLDDKEMRLIIRDNITAVKNQLNEVLMGKGIENLENTLGRIGRKQQIPHWYNQLKSKGSLPNLDGKSIGSICEMMLLSVLENYTFKDYDVPALNISPAKGVDYPELSLSVKSPSTNYCTSEPYFSSYERLLGGEYDCLVLLTNYQEFKLDPSIKLQISEIRYLSSTQLADKSLCSIGLKNRNWLMAFEEEYAKRYLRFLAFSNQGDWRSKHLTKIARVIQDDAEINNLIVLAEKDFLKQNSKRDKVSKPLIPDAELEAILKIRQIDPISVGVLTALDNWVGEYHKDFGRLPNSDEWRRLKSGSLNGLIGISPALQWRFNFGPLFGVDVPDEAQDA